MKSIFKIFLIFFIISLISKSDGKSLKKIINNRYKQMIEREFSSTNNDNNNGFFQGFKKLAINEKQPKIIDGIDENGFIIKDGHQHLPGYDCIHDQVAENIIVPPTDKEVNDFLHAERMKLLDTNYRLKASSATPRKPLRFYFDTTYLYNQKDTGACYYVGQTILLGAAPTSYVAPACVSSGAYYPCNYTCTANDLLGDKVANLISKDIITSIQDILGEMILVDRYTTNLKLNHDRGPTCDFRYVINNTYINTGIPNADMVVFVTSRPIRASSTIAYSSPCVFNWGERPLAATINFAPKYFLPFVSSTPPSDFIFNEYIRVGIHEMTHGLGFSNTFFKTFKNRYNGNGYYYTGTEPGANQTTSGTTPKGATWIYERPAVNTPAVKSFVESHYNCRRNGSIFELLEDYGAAGTVGSHWEKRTAGEEYMLGYVSPVFPITNLTLALLQDSGWFDINSSLAEPLMWGKGLGCDWLDDCNEKSWNLPGYFCQDSSKRYCSPTRVGKGVCNVKISSSDILVAYRHFNDSHTYGDIIADGCPFYDIPSNQYCVDASNQASANTQISEKYGEDSRCFEYTDTTTSNSNMVCWPTRCDGQNLQVQVNTVWVTCDTDGKSVKIGNIQFTCPLYFYPCQDSGFSAPPNSSYPNYPGIENINNSFKLSLNIYLLISNLILIIFYLI
ncbi:hypothetical protein DDB_G0268270 [Dictyostelium discoideum AX4]|uniref:Uncharacterized protein n=1 Tax=Dictyostelium discoideum TaxID=44689 RepID=Q55GT0_DICDI|nr:hypothetical protein DDB_G0268270 [Dictyostelium discoideum AX4]EAL73588.1 hypothetical protein DDB_G0268270 [Dictyostelium discoideum AX4]|eukprot:XP_647104.1 hypothetical protein DDB_G0268270 [Dictyostelium discoideum AX4]